MMPKAFKKFLCTVFDHKWVKQSELEMSVGPRGKGTMIWEECSRCGETRSRFIADINFGALQRSVKKAIQRKLPVKLVEEIDNKLMKDVDTDVTEQLNEEVPTKPRKARAKKALAEAA